MFKFLKAFLIFLQMYRYGFFFSQNTHRTESRTGRKSHWGFYRFNHRTQASLFDVDFEFGKDHSELSQEGYFHVHGDDVRIRLSQVDPVRRTRALN